MGIKKGSSGRMQGLLSRFRSGGKKATESKITKRSNYNYDNVIPSNGYSDDMHDDDEYDDDDEEDVICFDNDDDDDEYEDDDSDSDSDDDDEGGDGDII